MAGFLASLAVAGLLVVIVVKMLGHPYAIHRYHAAQFLIAAGAFGAVAVAIALVQAYRNNRVVNLASASRHRMAPRRRLIGISDLIARSSVYGR